MSLVRTTLDRLLGRRTPEKKWDAFWAKEGYAWLGRIDELAHYSVLAGYALELKPGGAVLDVGCGDGILRDRLHPAAFSTYVGLDFSEAIARAEKRKDDRTTFVVGDLLTYEPTTRFDTIVFNESLYYAKDVVSDLNRYARFMAPDGVFLVSTHLKDSTAALWSRIRDNFAMIDAVTVTNAKGVSWMCGAFQASSAGRTDVPR